MVLRELLAKFGVAYDDKGAKKADKDVSSLKQGFNELVGILGGAALIKGFAGFIENQIAMADAIGDSAAMMGIGVEALQELRFAGQDVGISAEGVDAALSRLGRGAAEAAKGQGEAKDAFRELGVSLTDSQGNLRSVDELVMDVAEGMGETGSEADRMRLGFKLFGREGAKFVGVMGEGKEGIQALREEAQLLGGVLSEDQVAAADKADKAINAFKFALQGVKNEIAMRFIPGLTAGLRQITGWGAQIRTLLRTTSSLQAAIVTIGIAIGAMIGPARILAMGKAVVLFGLLFLVVEDIITFLRGGDSVVGDFLDAIAGAGAAKIALEGIREAVMAISVAFEEATTDAGKFFKEFGNFLVEDYFRESFELGANIAASFEETGDKIKKNLAKQHGVGEDPGLGLSDRAERGIGGAPVSPFFESDPNEPIGAVTQTIGRGMDAPLMAQGRSKTRGMPGAARATATAVQGGGAGGVTVQQNNPVTVNVNGAADPEATARAVAAKAREELSKSNRDAVRALRQTGARR